MLQASTRVNGTILWANLHLLFWLSLIPFVTAWMGENEFAPVPVAVYGVVFLLAGVAYNILERALITLHGKDSLLATALGREFKGKISLLIYSVAILLTFANSWLPVALYGVNAVLWLVPDRRIEKTIVR